MQGGELMKILNTIETFPDHTIGEIRKDKKTYYVCCAVKSITTSRKNSDIRLMITRERFLTGMKFVYQAMSLTSTFTTKTVPLLVQLLLMLKMSTKYDIRNGNSVMDMQQTRQNSRAEISICPE